MCLLKKNVGCFLGSMFLLLLSFTLRAQLANVSFKHLSLKEGLSQSPVFSLFQDRKGFVWIGNREGLIRFDGYDFKKYVNKAVLRQTTIHNDIRSICEDSNGNLWLGTSTGVYEFNTKSETFLPINFPDMPLVFSIVPDGETFWVGTSAGLRHIDVKTRKQIIENFTGKGSQQIKHGWIASLYQDNHHTLWVGMDKGISALNTRNKQVKQLPAGVQSNEILRHAKVFTIKQDRQGDMWFGTETKGLFWYNAQLDTCIQYDHDNTASGMLSNFVRDIFVYDHQNIWVGTRNGLNIFNKATRRFTSYRHNATEPNSLSHNTVWNFLKDDAGNIWLATYAGGINIYNPANSNFLNIGEKTSNNIGLNEPLVNAVLPLKNQDALWVGTDGGGLNYIDRKANTVSVITVKDKASKRVSDIVKALALDSTGNIIAGTLDGLATLNVKSKKLKYFNFFKDPSSTIRINALLAEKDGIWVGTEQNGLKFIRNNGDYDSFTKSKGNAPNDNYINSLVKHDQELWIGTRSGLNCYNTFTKRFSNYQVNGGSIASNVILSLYLDSKNNLWAGTGNGLFIFDVIKKQYLRIGEYQGLNNQVIQAITEDVTGSIWVSTFNGLSKIVHRKNNRLKQPNTSQIINYMYNDGLASNQFSLGAVACKGSELFFGGVNGITTFFPQNLITNRHQPKVVITELMINNKLVTPYTNESPLEQPIENTKAIILNYTQNYLSFKFAALSFLNAQNNQYAYQLDGLQSHEGWHYSGTQRSVNYTNLEPGSYVFKLKAANNDGLWSRGTTDIKITVLPPYWKTWWAYALYIIVLFTTMYIIIRFIRSRAKLERDLYYEHVENERQQDLNRMKLDFFTNISHELRTPLTLIIGPVENLLKNMPVSASYEQLQLIKNNSNRLLKLVSELLDFRKAETGHMNIYVTNQNVRPFLSHIFNSFKHMATASNINYEFIAEEDVALYFDDSQLEKVIYNLLANAFKFTPNGGKIVLQVKKLAQTVEITVSDSGKGIPYSKQEKLFTNFYQVEDVGLVNTGSGIGLALAKNIIDLHKGSINVYSNPVDVSKELRTHFKVSLKLGSAHFDKSQLLPKTVHDDNIADTAYAVPGPVKAEISVDQNEGEKRYSIQIIEDNDELRNFLCSSLKQNYIIHESINGSQGWQMAVVLIPDIIISDVMMPEMNGLELTSKLKTDDRTSHIPVILLTARSAQVHQINGLETGADVYLTKPFSIHMLELHIHNLLTSRQILQQKYSQQVTLEPQHISITLPDQKFLIKIMSIIEDNIANEEFGVPYLSAEVGMSQPVLYKKVKALTDLSVNDFVKSIRLKKAAQLLEEKQFTVYEVAYAVGFADSKYFSKEFAKQFGVTPSAYKNSPKIIS
jgi:signal transduction histidine kinase/ligand-binding sensor domain-containing protein/DNA-binding response OmpR family regulator